MTDSVNVSDGHVWEQSHNARTFQHGGHTDGYVMPTSEALLRDVVDALTAGPYDGFAINTTSGTTVTIGSGEAMVHGLPVARDTSTDVTLTDNTNNQRIYIGWMESSKDGLLIGTQADFDGLSTHYEYLPLWDVDVANGSVGTTTQLFERVVQLNSKNTRYETDDGSGMPVDNAKSANTAGNADNANNLGNVSPSNYARTDQRPAFEDGVKIGTAGGPNIAEFGNDDSFGLSMVYRTAPDELRIERLDGTTVLNIPYNGTDIEHMGDAVLTHRDTGAGNELNADYVDGVEARQFLRSDQNDTINGVLELSASANRTGELGRSNGEFLRAPGGAADMVWDTQGGHGRYAQAWNAYWDNAAGAWKFISGSEGATKVFQDGGKVEISVSSGTGAADSAISWTTLRWNRDGELVYPGGNRGVKSGQQRHVWENSSEPAGWTDGDIWLKPVE